MASGVTSGAGARGQGILTAPPQKFCASITKESKIDAYPGLYKFYSQNSFFPPSLRNIYQKFWSFAPPLWVAPGGGRPPMPPCYATGACSYL